MLLYSKYCLRHINNFQPNLVKLLQANALDCPGDVPGLRSVTEWCQKKKQKEDRKNWCLSPSEALMHFLIPYKVNMCKSFLPFCLSFCILRHDISINFYWDKEFLLVFNFFNLKKQLLVNETVWKWFIFIPRFSLSFLFFLASFLWLLSQSGYCYSNLFPTFSFLFFHLWLHLVAT